MFFLSPNDKKPNKIRGNSTGIFDETADKFSLLNKCKPFMFAMLNNT
jgi:hypothetical protein